MTFTPRDVAPTVTVLGLIDNGFTTQVGQFTLTGQATALSVAQSPLDGSKSLAFVVSDPGSLDRPRLSINWVMVNRITISIRWPVFAISMNCQALTMSS